jgi:protein involved in polysaccharide export with SLBB domain
MKSITSWRLTQVVVWVLICATVAPPAVLAQTMMGGGAGSPVPFGLSPGGQFGLSAPGQPIITNPEALQPIVHSQAACPGQSGGSAIAPSMTQDSSGGAGRLTALGMTPGQAANQVSALGQAAGQSPGGSPQGSIAVSTASAVGAGSGVGVAIPKHSGLLSPLVQGQHDESQGNVGAALLSQVEPLGQLSIEEGFSRFFLLQSMTNQLKQFGYNFFDLSFSGFPQVMDMPVGPEYVLGPEDTLAVHIWNVPDPSFNHSYISTIERDGTIFVPQLGSIPVAGMTFAKVYQILHGKLSGLLKRFDLHVSMGKLRSIKVFVVGEVVRPGAYELSALATASHALYAACGPAKSGSLRHIQVMRGNKLVADLDFYQFFLRGDRSQDVPLQSGDTVFVTPIGPVAAIGGPVRRPAIYELKDRTTLPELLELAGGLAPSADRRRCQIFRIEAGKKRVIVDVNLAAASTGVPKELSTADTQSIVDGDFVRIASVSLQIENAVTLTGAVRTAGVYELRPGMRLLDLLTDQLLLDSYLEKAELVRTNPLTYETVVQPFSIKGLMEGKEENVELRRLDKVVVASQLRGPRLVSLAGEVKRPGTYTLEIGERLSSVLKRAGGMTARAFPQGLVLIRETVKQRQQSEIEKFVAMQKQRLTVEAAALSAGAVPLSGPAGAAQQSSDMQGVQLQMQALDLLVSRVQAGRVVLNIESGETLETSPDDVVLEESDQITVPSQPKTVTIIGAVRNSTNILHRDDFGVEDYLRAAGGVIDTAAEKETYIVRANGSTDAGYAKLKTIAVGDTIIVPEKVEAKTKPLSLWTSIAQIFSGLGIFAASLAVIAR